VRQVAPLLLQASQLRGDFDCLGHILTNVIGCQVDYAMPSQDLLLFTVHKPGMDSKEYEDFVAIMKPLFDFVGEWFVPMEMDCRYQVKDYQQHFVLSETRPLVLDYNTHL